MSTIQIAIYSFGAGAITGTAALWVAVIRFIRRNRDNASHQGEIER